MRTSILCDEDEVLILVPGISEGQPAGAEETVIVWLRTTLSVQASFALFFRVAVHVTVYSPVVEE